MCGRFTLTNMKGVGSLFGELKALQGAHYNIAPGQDILVKTHDMPGLQLMHWGLIPHWAKEQKIGYRMVNARAETLGSKPAFREALARRRCLIPADGFYEWRKNPDDTKTPMHIRLKASGAHRLFAFAGLWDVWRDEQGKTIKSCTIITTPANTLVAPIHDRMPAIMPAEDYDRWLDPGLATAQQAVKLLRPYAASEMEAFAVGRQVNNVKNDVPSLIAPEVEPPPARSDSLF